MPQSPSSSSTSSSEAERDYPPLPETDDYAVYEGNVTVLYPKCEYAEKNGVPMFNRLQLFAFVDADRAARATPPSLPIDFKQASEQGDGWLLDSEGRRLVGTSHHYTAQSIKALIWELKALEDPRMTTQADFENRDWRAWCGILHRVMSGLASEVPLAPEASEQGGWQWVPKEPTPGMMDAAWDHTPFNMEDMTDGDFGKAYQDMLAAAPQRPADLGGWLPIALAPKNTPVRLYAEGGGFYDEDFNPSGSVEGQWTDGTWCGAFWDPVHDTWFRRDDIVPTHFQYLPSPPSPHLEEGALLLGGDEGGKKGGA